jgi:hypothetical protein
MVASLYRQDPSETPHCGAIYKYRPVFWLNPPLWCLRNIQWTQKPPEASLRKAEELPNAFSLRVQDNEEDVMARAKIRHIVVLSQDAYAQNPGFDDVIIVPSYTLKPTQLDTTEERVRNNEFPNVFYLARDPNFPQMGECFLDFSEVRSLHKEFLQEGKLDVAFTPVATKAIIQRYIEFLSS